MWGFHFVTAVPTLNGSAFLTGFFLLERSFSSHCPQVLAQRGVCRGFSLWHRVFTLQYKGHWGDFCCDLGYLKDIELKWKYTCCLVKFVSTDYLSSLPRLPQQSVDMIFRTLIKPLPHPFSHSQKHPHYKALSQTLLLKFSFFTVHPTPSSSFPWVSCKNGGTWTIWSGDRQHLSTH